MKEFRRVYAIVNRLTDERVSDIAYISLNVAKKRADRMNELERSKNKYFAHVVKVPDSVYIYCPEGSPCFVKITTAK